MRPMCVLEIAANSWGESVSGYELIIKAFTFKAFALFFFYTILYRENKNFILNMNSSCLSNLKLEGTTLSN